MKKYISTKEVMAQPMTATEAVTKGYKVGNHEGEDGYEIEYKDGYKSWCPKDIFYKSNRCSETYLDRLAIEKDELYKKIQKLDSFINSPLIDPLDFISRELLNTQYNIMRAYHNILSLRFKKDSVEKAERESVGYDEISGQPNN